MRVIPLHRDSDIDYSCVSYWVLGDENATSDRNTLIDTGNKSAENSTYFFREMAAMSKGIGKMAVEQIILTHEHYDHAGGLSILDRQFAPMVYSWLPAGARHVPLHDGMHLVVGDQDAIILHTPGHSDDSICIYLPLARTLFSGDSVFRITDDQGSYSQAYLETLRRLSTLDVAAIYPGHGRPILTNAASFIGECAQFVARSIARMNSGLG